MVNKRLNAPQRPEEVLRINPITPSYLVRWGFEEFQTEDESGFYYWERQFDYKPELEEIKAVINEQHNRDCDYEIEHGFVFEGNKVWLTTENQMNYKSTWDLAYQTDGANLPIRFKFGTNENPVYRKFTEVDDLKAFYTKVQKHINGTLDKYWDIKDFMEWDIYDGMLNV